MTVTEPLNFLSCSCSVFCDVVNFFNAVQMNLGGFIQLCDFKQIIRDTPYGRTSSARLLPVGIFMSDVAGGGRGRERERERVHFKMSPELLYPRPIFPYFEPFNDHCVQYIYYSN
jgi:hypothetical protein